MRPIGNPQGQLDDTVSWLVNRVRKDLSNEDKALDFLRIHDPYSYRCKTAGLTGEQIALLDRARGIVGIVHSCELGQILAYESRGRSPPSDLTQDYARLLTAISQDDLLSRHIDDCSDCELFERLYWNMDSVLQAYASDVSELLVRPYGVHAWLVTLGRFQQDGYPTFEDYLAAKRSGSS